MTNPTGNGPEYPQGGGDPGQSWGTPPPGYGQQPPYGQQPGYGQAPDYGQPPGYGQPYSAAPGYGPPAAAAPQVDLATAVRSVLTQYTDFRGRARRSEYWWFVLAWAIAYVLAVVLDQVIGAPILTIVFLLGTVVPYLAVSVRRLHDTGRTGWWLLLNFIPFGGIVTLVFECLDSDPRPNQHGPSPKYQAAGGYGY